MSKNSLALKTSSSKKPVQRLRSVGPNGEVRSRTNISQVGERVRGLKNLIYTLLHEVQTLEHDELLSELTTPREMGRLDIEKGIKFDDVVRQFETNIIRRALLITGGNQARAARLLGIKPNTLNYKVKLYEIPVD
jgi:DNA-binding NtrC family response regulator